MRTLKLIDVLKIKNMRKQFQAQQYYQNHISQCQPTPSNNLLEVNYLADNPRADSNHTKI